MNMISHLKMFFYQKPNSKKILHGSIKYFNENYSGKKTDGSKYSHPTLSVVGSKRIRNDIF